MKLVVLMAVLVAALVVVPVEAHQVHSEHDKSETAGRAEPVAPERNVRNLIRSFRKSGDDDDLDEARSLVHPALEASPNDTGLLVDAALVAQARHEFALALELTKKALEIRRDDDQAWLLLASIHLVRGKSGEASKACRQLRSTSLLVMLTCRARVALVSGDAAIAGKKLGNVLAATDQSRIDGATLAWSFSVAGDLASASNDPEQAADYYYQSLERADSTQVRSALVDVLLDLDRLAEAADVLDAGAAALPLAVRRMIVAKRRGRGGAHAAEIHRADREFQRWIAGEDWLHAREMARFYVDVLERPALARRLAVINAALQKEPEDLRLEMRTRNVHYGRKWR